MGFQAKAKAYTITYKKLSVTVTPEQYAKLSDRKPFEVVLYWWGGKHDVKTDRIIGNKKFTLSKPAEVRTLLEAVRPYAEKIRKKIDAWNKKMDAQIRKDDARRERERAKQKRQREKARRESLKKFPLPDGLLAADLTEPDYKKRHTVEGLSELQARYISDGFELWHIGDWGWVIPTLAINMAQRNGTYRTYAIQVSNEKLCRVGNGPHVDLKVRVYLTKANHKRILAKYLPLITKGSQESHEARDLLSTRRLASRMRRATLGGLFA